MTPAELRTIGEKLYGKRWQKKMADALEVSPRSIHHWLHKTRTIRPPMAKLIRSLSSAIST
jgi:DNA-binding transcriptional regulator YdaS (Cro superfamily)